MQDFNKGDVVELNSGGPEMVVESYKGIGSFGGEDNSVDKSIIMCRWYNSYSNSYESTYFKTSTLDRVAVYKEDESPLQEGDVVVSSAEGGPEMTVFSLDREKVRVPNGSGGFREEEKENGDNFVSCLWWNENAKKYKTESFNALTISKK